MNIGYLDKIFYTVINDFYNSHIKQGKLIQAMFKAKNIVDNQKDFNTLLVDYFNKVELNEFKKLKTKEGFKAVSEKAKKYVLFYIFLIIGFHYQGSVKSFINGVVEFSRNQNQYNFVADEFFDTNSNSMIVELNNLIKRIRELIRSPDPDSLKSRKEYSTAEKILFNINSIKNLTGKLEKSSPLEYSHTLVKGIVLDYLYLQNEKKDLFHFIEDVEATEGDYQFIEIVVPTKEHIDFGTIESLFTNKEVEKGIAHNVWDYLLKLESHIDRGMSDDDKVNELLSRGILVPVVDNFLLYHKSNEVYPTKNDGKKITKARYIIDKIDTVSSSPKNNVALDRFFIPNMIERKAISVNHIEDIKIINKWVNRPDDFEGAELAVDLQSYLFRPYVNFINNRIPSFDIKINKTISAVRSVSLIDEDKIKQSSKSILEVISLPENSTAKIVGLVLPTPYSNTRCFSKEGVLDIRKLFKKKGKEESRKHNGYKLITRLIDRQYLEGKKFNSPIFWQFKPDQDHYSREDISKENVKGSDSIKFMVSRIYNALQQQVYNHIIRILDKNSGITIEKIWNIIDFVEKTSMPIDRNSNLWFSLEENIFSKYAVKVYPEKYHGKEDKIPGVTGKVISLPIYKSNVSTNNFNDIKLNVNNIDETGEKDEKRQDIGICQHNMTWSYVASLRNKNQQLYLEQLYKFFNKYVTTNSEGHYICVSCGFYIDVMSYVRDGYFDSNEKFVGYGSYMYVPLEDMPKYKRFSKAISAMHKVLDSAAISVNIPILVGKRNDRIRADVIRVTVDQILELSNIMKKTIKDRNQKASTLYGIIRQSPHFGVFVFDLDNSIFEVSGKELTDTYKMIKRNNILVYLMCNSLLEINKSQIPYLKVDKKGLGSFDFFEKGYHHIFAGLSIRYNNENVTVSLTEYKVLCFILYVYASQFIRDKKWMIEGVPVVKRPGKEQVMILKLIIHTFVDIINLILERGEDEKCSQTFRVYRTRFYNKLQDIFGSESVYNLILNRDKSSLGDIKSEFVLAKSEPISIKKFVPVKLPKVEWNTCRLPRFYPSVIMRSFLKYSNISNLTNCPSGEFHNWKYKNLDTPVCNLCNQRMDQLSYDDKTTDRIINNIRYVPLREAARKLCLKGRIHNYIVDKNTSKMVCSKCGRSEDYNYTQKELEELENIIENRKNDLWEDTVKKIEESETKTEKKLDYISKLRKRLNEEYESLPNGIYGYITNFVSLLEKEGGRNIDVESKLKDDIYILDHDHYGTPLDKPYIVTDTKNRISVVQNHSHYNRDVIIITIYIKKNIQMFYDSIRKAFLGYKVENSKYVDSKNSDKTLKIIYSIRNKLYYLGNLSHHTILPLQFPVLHKKIQRDSKRGISNEKISLDVISELARDRIGNLKSGINSFQRVFNRVLSGYVPVLEEGVESSDTFSTIYNKYSGRMDDVITSDSKGKKEVLKHWRGVDKGFILNKDVLKSKRITINNYKQVSSEKVISLDSSGNTILYYFISELTKLINYNTGPVRTRIVRFIIDYIINIYDITSNEDQIIDKRYKNLQYKLYSSVAYSHYYEQLKKHDQDQTHTVRYDDIEGMTTGGNDDEPKSGVEAMDVEFEDDFHEMSELLTE